MGEAELALTCFSPNFQGAIGYRSLLFSDSVVRYNGIWSRADAGTDKQPTKDGTPYTASYKWKYVAPGVDFMVNLSNLLCGWNPNRMFSATAFVGGGINWTGANQEVNDLAANDRESEQLSAGISLAREKRFALTAERRHHWQSRGAVDSVCSRLFNLSNT